MGDPLSKVVASDLEKSKRSCARNFVWELGVGFPLGVSPSYLVIDTITVSQNTEALSMQIEKMRQFVFSPADAARDWLIPTSVCARRASPRQRILRSPSVVGWAAA
jgi:hypothetical protein